MIPLGILFWHLSILFDNRPIEWVEYSKPELSHYVLRENRAVMLFFTADWDVNSLVVEKRAIATRRVKRFLRWNNIVPMKGDLTKLSPEVAREMKSIGRSTTPAIAIYSHGSLSNPSIVDGMFNEDQLHKALKESMHGR